MKTTLSREHRKILGTTVAQARATAEDGAEKTHKALAVAAKDAPAHASRERAGERGKTPSRQHRLLQASLPPEPSRPGPMKVV